MHKHSTQVETKQYRKLDSNAAHSWDTGDDGDKTYKSKISGSSSRFSENNDSGSSSFDKEMHNRSNNSSHAVSSHRQSGSFHGSDNDALHHSYGQLTNRKKKKKKITKRKANIKNKDRDKISA